MANKKQGKENVQERRVSGVADRRITIRDRRSANRVIGELNPRRKIGDRRDTKL
ncbi:MAG: hypothetical protein QGI68_21260 [Pseudomonadales bacterium]|nr:hypothetical protein [Pseudomonadales bacterium]MDP7357646.1 hypothetical protein [Pseudomonadales bacterium]MDP7598073.1 hypothetical protein [Pseudomonadales bacterium]HJN50812.1 hypothetical protein [Pseudomonadales bacterium]